MEEFSQKEKKDREGDDNPLKTYVRYSGIAVQMIVIILLAVWGGRKLDALNSSDKPIFTALLSLAGVVLAIYTSVKHLVK